MKTFYSSGEVAQLLGLSRERIQDFVREERLKPTAQTVNGMKLFSPAVVERFRQEREERRVKASAVALCPA